MKRIKFAISVFLSTLLLFGCSKNESAREITNDTYIIEVSNFSVDKITLTIKTSLTPEKTVTIPENTIQEIPVRAAAGEYVTFKVSKVYFASYRILDSRGVPIAVYESLPQATNNIIELDFIAFAVDDKEKNFLQYKTGQAKALADNLVGRPYKLQERYVLENGNKIVDANIQPECSFHDEYIFIPSRGEFGNFYPQRLILTPKIIKAKSPCSYNPGEIIPTGGISVFINGVATVSFPIWDRIAVDGHPSEMFFVQLTIDSLSKNGTLTLHREVGNKKEVFVYKPV